MDFDRSSQAIINAVSMRLTLIATVYPHWAEPLAKVKEESHDEREKSAAAAGAYLNSSRE